MGPSVLAGACYLDSTGGGLQWPYHLGTTLVLFVHWLLLHHLSGCLTHGRRGCRAVSLAACIMSRRLCLNLHLHLHRLQPP